MLIDTDDLEACKALAPVYQGSVIGATITWATPFSIDYVTCFDQVQFHTGAYRSEWSLDDDKGLLDETVGPSASFVPGGAAITEQSDPNALCDHLVILLNPDVFDEATDGTGVTRRDAVRSGTLTSDALTTLGRELRSALLRGDQDGYCPLEMDTLFEDAVDMFLRSVHTVTGKGRPLRRGGLSPSQIRRTVQLVNDSLTSKVDLEQMAAEIGMSRYHFARQFKASVGVSPYDFVLEARINAARRALDAGRLSAAQIALDTGFSDQAHMSNEFRKRLGVSPTQYRDIRNR